MQWHAHGHACISAPASLQPASSFLSTGHASCLLHASAPSCPLPVPPAPFQFEDEFAKDGHAAVGRRLLRLEAENARRGLPAGLAIEELDSAPQRLAGGGTTLRSYDVLPSGGRGDGGQPEQAEVQTRRRPWWRRLLGGPAGGSSDDDTSGARHVPPSSRGRTQEVQAARGRLVGTLHTRHGGQADSPLTQPLLEGSDGRGGPPVRGGGGRHRSLDVESLEGVAP